MDTVIAQFEQHSNPIWIDITAFWQNLILVASWRFLHQLSLHWWTQDFAKCDHLQLLEQWIMHLEQVYGDLLARTPTQKLFGELINIAVEEYGDVLSRL